MTETVKLSQLVEGETNPRAHVADLAPLIASIKAYGLLQPLVVRQIFAGGEQKTVGPKYEVIAGNRRLAALRKIHKSKETDVPVVVRQLAQSLTAKEIAVAENVVRANLHPVDEYNAYAAMIADGATLDGIAKRFGVKEKWIRQRLQLATLAEPLREAWLAGKMTAEQAEALSSSPDQAKQLEVWKAASGKNGGEYHARPDNLRRELRAQSVAVNDPRVKLIGFEAYVAAGGGVHEDLFSEAKTLTDEAIVNRLASEALEAEAGRLRADGWAWVECRITGGGYWPHDLDLEEFMDEAERKAADGDNWKARDKALNAARERAEADPAARARSGVLLSLDRDGEIVVRALLVKDEEGAAQEEARREARKAQVHAVHPQPAEKAGDEEPAPKVNHALRLSLSEQMTVALSKAVAETPAVALPALYASLRCALWSFYTGPMPFRIGVHERWSALDPKFGDQDAPTWAEEFRGATEVPINTLLNELALLLAPLVDARVQRYDHRGDMGAELPPAVEALADQLPTFPARLAEAFDVDGYFERVTAAQCTAALVEMDGRAPAPKKKGELAAQAAGRAKATGWLPVELRTSHYAGPTAVVKDAAQ